MAPQLRRCIRCGSVAPTTSYALVDDGLPVRQHRDLRRRCPSCGVERLARFFEVVRRRPPADRSSELVA